MTSSPRFTDNP